jgi:hypothetical protein
MHNRDASCCASSKPKITFNVSTFSGAIACANDGALQPNLFALFPQKRDGTLTRLKMTIETTIKMNGGEKVIIVPHSMGCVFLMYFLKWVEYPAPLGKIQSQQVPDACLVCFWSGIG